MMVLEGFLWFGDKALLCVRRSNSQVMMRSEVELVLSSLQKGDVELDDGSKDVTHENAEKCGNQLHSSPNMKFPYAFPSVLYHCRTPSDMC